MVNSIYIWLTLFFMFTTTLFLAQINVECGTNLSVREKAQIHQILSSPIKNGNYLDSIVPVDVHIIGFSDSTGAIDSATIMTELERVNQHYAPAGMYFVKCNPINFIYSDTYAYFEQQVDEVICDIVDFPNVLNLYFVPQLIRDNDGQTIQLCGYTYYLGNKNRVIISNQCAANGSSLAHEIGHYFSLLHTHDTTNGVELVARVNCNVLGDEFCDTPADPTLSEVNVNTSCQYIGAAQDPLGEAYVPDVRNIMSYSRKSCRDKFSIEQAQRMRTYFRSYRSYLYCINDGYLHTNSNNLEYVLFPNPSRDFLAVVTNESKNKSYHYCLYNYLGKPISCDEITNYQHLNITTLKAGTYFVALSNDSTTKIQKFIKY